MSAAEPCELLEWDTKFFGFPIARVCRRRLTVEEADRADAWCRERGIVCAYFLADPDDYVTLHAAQRHGFELCDARVTFALRMDAGAAGLPDPGVRISAAADLPRLRQIAGSSFHDSRFYFDRRFPRERCDALYAAWVENSVRRGPDAVLIADEGAGVQGFVTCDSPEPGEGRLGLLGVDAAARGQGWGFRLVQSALDWFRRRHVKQVWVGTQVRNIRSQRLYQRFGFLTEEVLLWYHRWFAEPPREVRA